MRETEKTVDVLGRKFTIRKFDAFTGSYILYQLMEKVLPAALESKVDDAIDTTPAGQSLQEALPSKREPMSKEEFIKLQRDCLAVISEVLPSGNRPVFNENGTWGLNDVANNTPLVILLTIHSLAFNIGDFFAAGGLKELQSSLAGLLPVNTEI